MPRPTARSGLAALVVAGILPLGLAACGDTADESSSGSSSAPLPSSASTTAAEPPVPTASNSIPAGGTTEPSASAASAPFGPECSRLPNGADTSALSQERVATAAGEIPFLSRAAALIGTARLTDALDNASDITVFAPDDSAFADVGSSRLRTLLANPSTVDDVLKYHVVQGRLAPDQLAGSHPTLSGQQLEVAGSGEDFTVGGDAKVVCGNIQTANATVYVIDQVLAPPS